ncbi:MAG: TIGR01440 family protein [Lachnospiraceae bacterium]|nr:TIGR01440 family protein [Lachnospiraceae bacterium]
MDTNISIDEIIANQCLVLVKELVSVCNFKKDDVVVVGCSTSEVMHERIGTASNEVVGNIIFKTLYNEFAEDGVHVVAQCCEHLNRAIVVEAEVAKRLGLEIVNVVPHPHAGGAFATAAYANMHEPVVVEHIKADAGIDIGDTLIGMHLKSVAVPVRVETNTIGDAHVVCARVRPKYIGGERAIYDKNLE